MIQPNTNPQRVRALLVSHDELCAIANHTTSLRDRDVPSDAKIVGIQPAGYAYQLVIESAEFDVVPHAAPIPPIRG